MGSRLALHDLLKSILGSDQVYFQKPPSVRMVYPAIVYERSNARTDFADNRPYRYMKQYQVTVIDVDPDSPFPDKVAELPRCVFYRQFPADGLNHDVFTLYF